MEVGGIGERITLLFLSWASEQMFVWSMVIETTATKNYLRRKMESSIVCLLSLRVSSVSHLEHVQIVTAHLKLSSSVYGSEDQERC